MFMLITLVFFCNANKYGVIDNNEIRNNTLFISSSKNTWCSQNVVPK